MKYTKTPLTIAQSITLLQKRKLIIENQDRAEKYLNSIGYYRLTGYTFHLQKEDDDFLDGTKFDHIIKLYEFDKKLRAIVLEYLERIEICLRAKLNMLIRNYTQKIKQQQLMLFQKVS